MPGPKRRGDYIDLVKKGHQQTSGEITYFYTDRDRTVSVRVDFPRGLMTDWYPQASRPPEQSDPLTTSLRRRRRMFGSRGF